MHEVPEGWYELIDARLTGLIDDEKWNQLVIEHGLQLGISLMEEKDLRTAVSRLPRPMMPGSVTRSILRRTSGLALEDETRMFRAPNFGKKAEATAATESQIHDFAVVTEGSPATESQIQDFEVITAMPTEEDDLTASRILDIDFVNADPVPSGPKQPGTALEPESERFEVTVRDDVAIEKGTGEVASRVPRTGVVAKLGPEGEVIEQLEAMEKELDQALTAEQIQDLPTEAIAQQVVEERFGDEVVTERLSKVRQRVRPRRSVVDRRRRKILPLAIAWGGGLLAATLLVVLVTQALLPEPPTETPPGPNLADLADEVEREKPPPTGTPVKPPPSGKRVLTETMAEEDAAKAARAAAKGLPPVPTETVGAADVAEPPTTEVKRDVPKVVPPKLGKVDKEPVKKTAPAVGGVARPPVKEPPKQPPKQPVKEPAKKPAKEPAKEDVPQAVETVKTTEPAKARTVAKAMTEKIPPPVPEKKPPAPPKAVEGKAPPKDVRAKAPPKEVEPEKVPPAAKGAVGKDDKTDAKKLTEEPPKEEEPTLVWKPGERRGGVGAATPPPVGKIPEAVRLSFIVVPAVNDRQRLLLGLQNSGAKPFVIHRGTLYIEGLGRSRQVLGTFALEMPNQIVVAPYERQDWRADIPAGLLPDKRVRFLRLSLGDYKSRPVRWPPVSKFRVKPKSFEAK